MTALTAVVRPVVVGRTRSGRHADQSAPVRARRVHTMGTTLGDAILLLVIVFLIPIVILLVGSPLALFVRFLVEVVRRW